MSALHSTFYEGQLVKSGFSLCLIGAPNVGKSSLMNALCGKERAIVTNIPGTTRDLLEEEVQLAGLHFRLIDTAGIRETDEVVEKEGVRRSEKAAQDSDLILLVFDINHPTDIPLSLPQKKTIVIWNKIDLGSGEKLPLPYPHQVEVSAKERWGLDTLKEQIHQVLWQGSPPSKEELMITSQRHYQALGQAIQALETVLSGLQTEISPEFLVSDIRLALKELGTIIGIDITEEVLSAIFSKFCVGK
ncbi:MAG: 50S ribosome-binding GTPase [Chlamydiia bacterium]|nr:50S ribosome-binding GTPase [Chlamydiia bacterium]